LYGATGQVGSRIAAEAVARGHAVTGLSRSGGVVPTGTTPRRADATDADDVARIAAEHDVVVSAIGPRSDRLAHRHPNFLDAIAVLAEHVGSRRLIVVGHAGSLEVAPGLRLLDTSAYPERDKPEALAHATALEYLKDTGALLHWVYVSPPPVMTGSTISYPGSSLPSPASRKTRSPAQRTAAWAHFGGRVSESRSSSGTRRHPEEERCSFEWRVPECTSVVGQ